MSDLLVLRIVTKILMPFILLFALYVQFHGDYGPGGGFQAGVIFGAGFILYGLVYGLDALRGVLSSDILRAGFAIGVLIFAGVGVAGLFLGGNYLDYNVLASDPVKGQHLGILLIEFGVGVTVASVMISIFYYFAGRDAELVDFVGLYNYWIVVFLMMAGLYLVIEHGNLVKKMVGLTVFQAAVFVLYITLGKVRDGTAPIVAEGIEIYSNPLPHVLILTAIVVGVATLALGLALVVRIREAYGTIEEDEIGDQDGPAI